MQAQQHAIQSDSALKGLKLRDTSCHMPFMLCASVQCCFMGQVYRDAVRIHNRGSAAMKATLSLPHTVQPFLQAQPIAGFCQVCVDLVLNCQLSS